MDSGPELGIVPSIPIIPDRPPVEEARQVTEWKDRADLAEHSFDGQWRVLMTYDGFGFDLLERWVDGVDCQHWIRKR
jgi:hypothetical protein